MQVIEWSKPYRQGLLKLVEVNNDNGFKVILTNLGASIHRIYKNDVLMNVSVMDESSYFDCPPMYGKTIGRYAGRIEDGLFKLNDKLIELDHNNGDNCLHGGKDSIGYKLFDYEIKDSDEEVKVIYTLHDKENLFPGNIDFKVVYTITLDSKLIIDHYAISDKDTIINMTNHIYFNLNNDHHHNCSNHSLMIDADKFTKLKENMCLDKVMNVNKVMDFRNEHQIIDYYNDESIQNHSTKGYDHCYILNDHDLNKCVASLYSKESGYKLNVYTTYPCIVLYTTNYPGEDEILSGIKPQIMQGVCLECQYMPNSINYSDETIFKKDEQYHHTIIFSFEESEEK